MSGETFYGKKLRSKFETLRLEIKDDVRMQHDLATLRQIFETFNGTSIVRKKTIKVFRHLKEENELASQLLEIEHAEEFNGQSTDVFNRSDHSEVPFLSKSAPFMEDIVVSNEGATNFLKGLNPSKILGHDELFLRVLKELATELRPVFCPSFPTVS